MTDTKERERDIAAVRDALGKGCSCSACVERDMTDPVVQRLIADRESFRVEHAAALEAARTQERAQAFRDAATMLANACLVEMADNNTAGSALRGWATAFRDLADRTDLAYPVFSHRDPAFRAHHGALDSSV